MKAQINKDGFLQVIAETYTEAFAIKGIEQQAKERASSGCGACSHRHFPLILDVSVLAGVV